MPLVPLVAGALLAAAAPGPPEPGLVSLIDCPHFPLMFERDAARLDQQHRQQLDWLVEMVRQFEIAGSAVIVLGAYAPARDQARWSRRRIHRVRSYLIAHGISADRLRTAAEPRTENDLLGGPSDNPQVSYVVFQIFVPPADRARLHPPGAPLC